MNQMNSQPPLPNSGWWEDVLSRDPWMVWSPEHRLWFIGFNAELAAKYAIQGCAVRLAPNCEHDQAEIPHGEWPEAVPNEPPFSGSEIVWSERASRYLPEFYSDQWNKIKAYLEREHCDPVDVILAKWRSLLGEWGGGYDLEAAGFNQKPGVLRVLQEKAIAKGGAA